MNDWYGFLLVLGSISIVPGPSDFVASARAVTHGLEQTWILIAGILIADLTIIILIVNGINQVSVWLDNWRDFMKYLACTALLSWAWIPTRSNNGQNHIIPRVSYSSFATGFIITFSDPKAFLFYVGILPVYFDLKSWTWVEMSVLFIWVSCFIIISKISYSIMVLKGMRMQSFRRNQRYIHNAIKVIITVLGLNILFT